MRKSAREGETERERSVNAACNLIPSSCSILNLYINIKWALHLSFRSLSIYISLPAAAAANHVAVNLSTMFHTLSRSRGKQDVCTGRASCSGRGQSSKGAAKKINQLLSKIELAVEHTQVVLAQRHRDRQSAACMLLKYVSVRQRQREVARGGGL